MKKSPELPSLQKKQRFFQGIPVREARGDILVKPTKGDIDKATPHDPENCVYAVCVKRMLQTQHAYVYTNVAYIETSDEDGNTIMERYMVRNSARHWMQRYDQGDEVKPGGFVLHKAPPSYTLDAKARYGRRWVRANPERVKTYQKHSWEKRKAPHARQLNGVSFRDGTGQVRFIGTYDGKIKTRHE
jgi:hypothetical protein